MALPPHSHPPPHAPPDGAAARLRRMAARRPVWTAVLVAGVFLAALAAGGGAATVVSRSLTGPGEPAGQWRAAAGPTPNRPTPGEPSPTPAASPQSISLSATGDIIFGDAGALPADSGAGFFDGVADALAADLVMGNLEQPLTGDTGHRKCGEGSEGCHAFRAPPDYAAHLVDGGFELLNLANNHGNDFGPQGRANTGKALDQHGLAHTGERDQVTVVEVEDVDVAVVGFSPYAWTNDLNDLGQASEVVSQAAGQADLVVVQAHMGAEGSGQTRVRPGPETFFGEARGDPMAFARAVIDAGADLVVGHGPHVLRGLEFYRGRLVAYSLGNFAGGGGTLNASGNLGLGAVLKVSLHPDGEFAGGRFVSTHMYDAGLPNVDSKRRSLELVRELTEQDFPDTGARLDADGTIEAPPAG